MTSLPARIALLAVGVLLTGCSSDGGEAAPVPLPAVSATPSQVPPALPAPRRSGTAGEVERAVLAYFSALNDAAVSGDTTAFRRTFTPGCSGCRAFADRLDALHAKGQRLDGARDVVSRLDVQTGAGRAAAASVAYTIPSYRVLGPGGAVVGTYDGAQEVVNMALEKQSAGGWLVISSRDATS